MVEIILIMQVTAARQLSQYLELHPLALGIDLFTIPDQRYLTVVITTAEVTVGDGDVGGSDGSGLCQCDLCFEEQEMQERSTGKAG